MSATPVSAPQTAGTDGRVGEYDVFVSYRSASSRNAARQVSQALFALSKRHLVGRRLRVFLDTDALTAGALGQNITTALEHARNLVVCLDPQTKDSEWVGKEIEHWLGHGGDRERLFIVRTSPALDLSWDDERATFVHAEQLPATLRTLFSEEQKYFDAHDSGRTDPSLLGGLYAALMRIDPADLALDEARYQRRRRRVLSAFTGGLAILLVLAIVASVLAVRSSARSQESALRAQGEAAAAQALLTLPYSPPDAIEQVLDASRKTDSLSVRSALIAVASSTGNLRRTVDWSTLGTGRPSTGMAYSGDGEKLLGWGPDVDVGSTRFAAWSVTSGERMVSGSIPAEDVTSLVEVGAVGYLACSPRGPIFIDRHSLAVRELGPLNGVARACSTTTFRGGALAQASLGEDSPSEVVYVSLTGQVEQIADARIERVDPQSWSAALGRSGGLVLLSAYGRADVDLPDGSTTRMASSTGRYLVRDSSGWSIVRQLPDGAHASVERLRLPAGTRAVSLYGSGNLTKPAYAWVDTEGRVGWSRSDATLQLPAPISGTVVGATDLVPDDFESFVVAYGGTIYSATPPENGTSWELSRLGDYRADQASAGAITSFCDEGEVVGTPGNQWLMMGVAATSENNRPFTAASDDAYLDGCTLVDPGPPLSIDGAKVSEGALDGQVITAPKDTGGGIAIVRRGFPTQILNTGGHTESTWRFLDDSGVVSGNGERRLLDESGTLTSVADGSDPVILGTIDGVVRAVAPDGLGAAVTTSDQQTTTETPHFVRGGRVMPLCATAQVEFLPGPSFTTSIEDAEAQTPVDHGETWSNCLTGQTYDFPADVSVEAYQIGRDHASISWSQTRGVTTARHLTTWRPGHAETLVTRDVPNFDAPSGASVQLAYDPSGDHLAVSEGLSGLVRTWSWTGGAWQTGAVLQSSLGAVSTSAWSPDGTLLYTIGLKGGFELFDATNGRRLIVDQRGFELSDGEIPHAVSVSEVNGFDFVHLQVPAEDGLTSKALEVAVGIDQLRSLLCVIHNALACHR